MKFPQMLTGSCVELRDGNIYIVIATCNVKLLINRKGLIINYTKEYRSNGYEHYLNPKLNILKVYQRITSSTKNAFIPIKPLLWEFPTTLTRNQIAEKFGIPVENLKIIE